MRLSSLSDGDGATDGLKGQSFREIHLLGRHARLNLEDTAVRSRVGAFGEGIEWIAEAPVLETDVSEIHPRLRGRDPFEKQFAAIGYDGNRIQPHGGGTTVAPAKQGSHLSNPQG